MPSFRSDETIRLRDGRRLAYREWGPIDGPAVLLFHGSPGSRVWCPNEAHTHAANVRLILVDRPGYGRSEPNPGRTIGSWAVDTVELCELLRIERFGVIGVSAGAPYALAITARSPERLTGTCITTAKAFSTHSAIAN